MKRFLKRLMMLGTIIIGVSAASCAARASEHPLATSTALLPDTVDVRVLTYVQIFNNRHEGFTMYVLWLGHRQELGYVDPNSRIVYPMLVPHGTMVRAELHLDGGFRCVTKAVVAFQGSTLTLRLNDGQIAPSFCEPLRSATFYRSA